MLLVNWMVAHQQLTSMALLIGELFPVPALLRATQAGYARRLATAPYDACV